MKQLSAIAGGKILDVATGGGGFIDTLIGSLQSCDEIIGIDLSSKRFEQARREYKGARVRFATMDAAALAFPDNSFDTVTICNSLHHLADVTGALREMKRVLRPGGHCIIMEMYGDNQNERQLTHVQMHLWWAEIDRRRDIPHFPTFTRAELIQKVTAMHLGHFTAVDYIYPDDMIDQTEMETFLEQAFSDYFAKLDDLPDTGALRAQGQALQRRLADVGFAWATELLIIGVK